MPRPHTATETAVPRSGRWIWWGSLALFCLAGATGVLFRMTAVYGGVERLSLANIRHAHSHLMYMGWATPALMGLIWGLLPREATMPYRCAFHGVVGATFATALLCYPLFLLYGYSPVQLGPVYMPVAAAASGLNILCWYAFVGLYVVGTWGRDRTGALRLWDVAVGVLVVSTLGAWGIGVLHGIGVQSPIWTTAAIHFYLDLFSEGWFVLGMMGVAVATIEGAAKVDWTRPLLIVGAGLPFSFLMALPSAYLSGPVALAGRGGGLLVGGGLLLMVSRLGRCLKWGQAIWLWGLPLLTLGLKAAAQVAGAVVPGVWVGDGPALRVLYLHLMLLGFVSMGLVAGARLVWHTVSRGEVAAFYGAVGLVLVTLGALVWPGGGLAREAAAWGATVPVGVGLAMLGRGLFGERQHPVRSHSLSTPSSE